MFFSQTVCGAVQPTPPPQQTWPPEPQLPPMQPALTHMPWPCGQAEPLETHWLVP